MRKSKKMDVNKEREIYEYLKEAIFSSFAKDENGKLIIDITPYMEGYEIFYSYLNVPREMLKAINCKNETINSRTSYIDDDSRPFGVDDMYGYKTHGGSISLNGDYVPSYFDKDDHPGGFGRMF